MRFKIMLMTAVLIICFQGQAPAQPVGTTSLQFLKIMPNARALAMGGAYVSVTEGSEAAYWNPGGLARLHTFEFAVSYVDYLIDTYITAFSAAYSFGDFGAVALFGTYMRYGDIYETREDLLAFDADGEFNPGLTGSLLNPMSLCVGVAYSRKLTNQFSLGIAVKYLREDLVQAVVNSWSVDPGIQFDTGFRSIRIGVAIRNFGPEVKFAEDTHPIPQELDLGLSAFLFAPENALLFRTKGQSLMLAGSILHPRDYDQQFSLGMEYCFREAVYLRCGYKFNYDIEGLSLGFGLHLYRFTLDYAFSNFGEYFDGVQRFSFSFEL